MPVSRSSPVEPAEPTVNDPGAGDREVLRLLASGRLSAVCGVLDRRGRRDGLDLVARTDARARGLMIQAPDVQAVLERVERDEPAGSPLRFWCYAALAERLLLDIDATALLVARQALDLLDELDTHDAPGLPPTALRYARARLLRIESLLSVLQPCPEDPADRRAGRDEVVAELLTCGLVDEVHVTRGLLAGLTAVLQEEDIVESYDRLLDARAALTPGAESVWPSLLDALVSVVAFEVGDLAASMEALDRIERPAQRDPRLDGVVAYGRAFFRLVTGGVSPTTLACVEDALATARRDFPRLAQLYHGHVAKTLADVGDPSCGHFVRLEAELPANSPRNALDRAVLQLRVDALEGRPPAADRAIRRLERLEAIGHRRAAGRAALRLAHDIGRAGATGDAVRVHDWGRDRVPAGSRATQWEEWWARPVGTVRTPRGTGDPLGRSAGLAARAGQSARARRADGPARDPGPARAGAATRDPGLAPGGHRPPPLDVRVMAPAAELAVDGTPVAVTDNQARLLLALVLAHPAPVHVERAIDVLWPDDSPAGARRRLNSLVHRLRGVLGAHRGAVVRAGDRLALDPGRWRVDLWELRSAPAGMPVGVDPGADGPAEVRAALAAVRGVLCDAQLPYDEVLVDERHRIRAEWLRRARSAVAAAPGAGGEPGDLGAALAALGLDPGDL